MLKKLLFTFALMGLLVLFVDPNGTLLSKFLRLEEPTTYQIQQGDWLSKIAKRYYGDISYWRELELINRAPDGDLIFPGEKIIVPSYEAIQKVRKARALSDVNGIVQIQQDILAGKYQKPKEIPLQDSQEQQVAKKGPSPETEPPAPEQSDEPMTAQTESQDAGNDDFFGATNGSEKATPFYLSTPFVTGVVVLAVIVAVGLFFYLRKKRQEDVEYYGDTSAEDEDKSENKEEERSAYFFDDYEKEDTEKDRQNKGKEAVLAK